MKTLLTRCVEICVPIEHPMKPHFAFHYHGQPTKQERFLCRQICPEMRFIVMGIFVHR